MEPLSDYNPKFIPVPTARNRHDGWTPERQRQFLQVLAVTGTVDSATNAVGMSRNSAYGLREREGAESFVRCWEEALSFGRQRQFDYAMECAINGVTTVRFRLGGIVDFEQGIDMRMMMKALREEPHRRKASKRG
ncbi:MAG: hypothetical protein ACRCY3_07790 [Sphingorhabdus sp.]